MPQLIASAIYAITMPVSLTHLLQTCRRQALPSLLIGLTLGSLTAYLLNTKPPTYTAEGKLRFERLSPTANLTGLNKEAADPQPLGNVTNPLNNEAETLRSRPLIQKTIDRLDLKDNQDNPLSPDKFLTALKVKDLLASDVMQVRYSSRDRQAATRIVNTLMELYLEEYNREYHQRNATAQSFLEKQLPQAETTVKQAENTLSDFMTRHQIVAIKDQATAAITQTTDLQKQIAAVKAQLADTTAQTTVLQDNLGTPLQNSLQSTTTSQSPLLLNARKELQQIEAALTTARSLYQEDHPEVQTLLTQQTHWQSIINQHAPNLAQPLSAIEQDLTKDRLQLEQKRQGLTQQLISLTETSQQIATRAQTLPDLEKTQRQLQRHLEAAQLTHSQLLARLNETRLAKSQNIGNARILAPATLPTKPNTSPALIYSFAACIGLLGAGATAWWRDRQQPPHQDRTLQHQLNNAIQHLR